MLSSSAHAYIGPGLGAGTIGVVMGVLATIFLTLIAIVWYPVKRLMKKLRRKKVVESQDSNSSSD